MVFIGVMSSEGVKGREPFSFPGGRERGREATVLEPISRLHEALVVRP
jgi:hypothetical protein